MALARHHRFNILVNLLVLLAGLAGLAYWYRDELATWPAARLVRDDHTEKAAAPAFLLLGNPDGERAARLTELARDGTVQRIAFGLNEPTLMEQENLIPSISLVHREWMVLHGVAKDAIAILPCVVTSTFEEALCARDWLRSMTPKPDHIVVVTSWYHTRRAGWLFDRVMADDGVKVAMVPAYTAKSRPETWWKSEESALCVVTEYIKTVYWWFRGVNVGEKT